MVINNSIHTIRTIKMQYSNSPTLNANSEIDPIQHENQYYPS